MKKLITVFLMTIAIMGNSCTNNRSKLEELLHAKYQEDFIIHDDTYNFELGLREFNASPKRFPDLKFYGRHDDSNWVHDYYAESIQSYELQKKVKDTFKESNLKIFAKCNVASGVAGIKNNKVTDLVDVLQDSKDTSIISNAIYVFENIDQENKAKLLRPVYELLNFYNRYNGKKIFIEIDFWDETFLKNKNLDSLNLTFNIEQWDGEKYQNDDNINNKKKYVKNCLSLAFVTPFKAKINIDSLYSFIQPYNFRSNDETLLK